MVLYTLTSSYYLKQTMAKWSFVRGVANGWSWRCLQHKKLQLLLPQSLKWHRRLSQVAVSSLPYWLTTPWRPNPSDFILKRCLFNLLFHLRRCVCWSAFEIQWHWRIFGKCLHFDLFTISSSFVNVFGILLQILW